MKIINKLSIILAAAVLLQAAPAAAEGFTWRFDFSLGVRSLYSSDPGYDRFEKTIKIEDRELEDDFFETVDFGFRFFVYEGLAVRYSYFSSGRYKNSDGYYDYGFYIETNRFDLLYELDYNRYVRPYFVVGFGEYVGRTAIKAGGSSYNAKSTKYSAHALVGVDAIIPFVRDSMAVGLYLEAGYCYDVAFDFKEAGDLTFGGPEIAFGVRYHFLDAELVRSNSTKSLALIEAEKAEAEAGFITPEISSESIEPTSTGAASADDKVSSETEAKAGEESGAKEAAPGSDESSESEQAEGSPEE